jgi:hypothetical protein
MRGWLLGLLLLTPAVPAAASDVDASPPQSVSVTIYRAPYRTAGSIRLDQLGGFALVTETRTVRLPAGESRLRFLGVVDGIQPETAIVTGLPSGVVEKNRDAALLSPEALVRAAVDSELTLVRTNRKTGKTSRIRAVIRSANDEGAVFETAEGVEALHCSGVPETLRFDRVPNGLSSTPTLSALTRTHQPVTAQITLSYLANGFDWAANYVAQVNPGGKTLDLDAWITLANGNGVSLPDAGTQIVAGRLNRSAGVVVPYEQPARIVARCWPQGTTSDTPEPGNISLVHPYGFDPRRAELDETIVTAERKSFAPRFGMLMAAPVNAAAPPPPPPEQLGDLKLYRVSQPTTVAARQSKQVRLLAQSDVPFSRLCTADLSASGSMAFAPATILLRTKNTLANNLGLPLPSGGVAVFDQARGRELLVGEAGLHDTAVDEDVELTMGQSPDVEVKQTRLSYTAGSPEILKLSPEIALALRHGRTVEEVEITNARASETTFELRLRLYGAQHMTDADQPMAMKDGRPIFRLTLPANGSVKVRYVVSR